VFFGTDNDSVGVVWNESGVSLFRHIQAINGSRYDDTLIGNDQNNLFYTEAGQDNVMLRGGDDEVYLGLGNKMVDGGSGLDKVNYSGVGTAITASGDMRLW
jgi:Ca2+-binding RTX toxin-like protein